MSKSQQNAFIFIKLLIVVGILLFIYFKLKDQEYSLEHLLSEVRLVIASHPYFLGVVLALMPLNWMLESFKWQFLAKKIANLRWQEALKGVLTGLSLSFVTPHGLGDYIGRIMLLENEDRAKLGGAVLLGRLCQMSVTVFFGLFGLSYFVDLKWLILSSVIILTIIIISQLTNVFKGISIWNLVPPKIDYYLGILRVYRQQEIVYVFVISLARYLIFTLQLVILLHVFNERLMLWDIIQGATWIFLAKSIIPTFNFLSDLGVREFSAIYFFDHQLADLSMVVAASLLLWIINILIPTLIGTPLVFKIKMKSS